MTWTALIPIKAASDRKSRLAGGLAHDERERLGRRMFEHVVSVARAVSEVEDVVLLAPSAPEGWSGKILVDEGRGLNAELADAAAMVGRRPLLIIHGDLPLVRADDLSALIAVAEEEGSALAPDRHGTGTNALALAVPVGFPFAFGPGSFQAHLAVIGTTAAVVSRPGLALDVDTAEDLRDARAAGAASLV